MEFDLLIRDACIIDGTGVPAYRANVGVVAGKIAWIGTEARTAGRTITLAADEVLAPGFIDGHSHPDKYVFYDRRMTPKLLQGVTTDVGGNCGLGIAPVNAKYLQELENNSVFCGLGIDMPEQAATWQTFDRFLQDVDALRPEIHLGFFVGHGALRIAVKGYDDSAATVDELAMQIARLREALASGAVGMSAGMEYAPGCFASYDEMVALCGVLREHDKLYAVHLRNEDKDVVPAVDVALQLARKTGVKLLLSHHKVVGSENAKYIDEIDAMIVAAQADGVRVYRDQYPYDAGATTLTVRVPPRFLAGGVEKFVAKIKTPDGRAEVEDEMRRTNGAWENPDDIRGFRGIYVLHAARNPECSGKNLEEIALLWGVSPFDALFRLLIENHGHVFCRLQLMHEADVERIFQRDDVMVASDAILAAEHLTTHPRAFATYPRVLGRFVRERGLVSLETAIHKMTAMPADCLGFSSKGRILVGHDADLVVFDAKTILDCADYEMPRRENIGISYVIVGGNVVVDHGVIAEQRAGRVLRV